MDNLSVNCLACHSEVLHAPLYLLNDLLLLIGCEIVLEVEKLTLLFDGFVSDFGSNRCSGKFEQGLDVQIVGCVEEIEESFIIDINKLGIPGADLIGDVGRSEGFLNLGPIVVQQVPAEQKHFIQNGLLNLNGDRLLTTIFD